MARRIRPTGRGVTLLAVGVVALAAGVWAHYPGAVGFGLAAVVAVLASLVGLLTSPRVKVRRLLPAGRVRRLSELTVPVLLTHPNTGGSLQVRVAERVNGRRRDPVTVTVPSGGAARLECPVDTTSPGTAVLGPMDVTRSGFAGLAGMHLTDGRVDTVTVLARRLPVTLPDIGSLPQDSLQPDEVEGGGTELRSLRHYVPGDDIRRVNARISARFGTLMIREDAEPAISAVTVLVNNAAVVPPTRYAEMLDVATSICAAGALAGVPIGWCGRGMDAPVQLDATDAADLEAAEVAIACLTPSDDVLPRMPSADLTVLVTAAEGADDVAASVTSHGDHRLLVVLALSAPGADVDEQSGSRGRSVVTAVTAEECLRRFGRIGSALAAVGR